MVKPLNDTKLTILSAAAARDDRRVLPLPKLRAPAVVVRKTLTTMLADGLVEEISAGPDDKPWERSETDGVTTLIITDAGLAAIGITDEAPASPTRANKPTQRRTRAKKTSKGTKGAKKTPRASTGDKRESKQDLILLMLGRAGGASVAEMSEAVGWQLHSTRGFLTATVKGRLGLPLTSKKGRDGVRRYFVGR